MRGFTLAELMVSMGLFALVSLGLLGVFLSSRSADRTGLVNAQAADLARAELARLKGMSTSRLELYLTDPPAPYNVTSCGTLFEVRPGVARMSTDAAQPEYRLLDLRTELLWQQRRSAGLSQAGALLGLSQVRLVMHTVVAP